MTRSLAELVQSNEQFRLLVDAVQEYAIFLLDTHGRVSSWNLGAERIKHYLANEIIGQHFSVFYTQADQAIAKPEHALLTARTCGSFKDDGWRVKKDGTEFWASVVISAIYDGGHLVGYSKVTRDLTFAKRSEQALLHAHEQLEARVRERTAELDKVLAEVRLSQRRNEAIVNAISAVLWRWDLATCTFHAVPAWHQYTGLDKRQIKSWSWINAIHLEDRNAVNLHFMESISSATALSTECRILRHGSEYRHIAVRGVPLFDDAGSATEIVGICIDITDQKNLEEQLRHSQKLEAVGQLAGGIAHDFNNLLTVILSYGELLQAEGTMSDSQKQQLDEIVNAGRRAASLTQQLLTFSRRTFLELTAVNVNAVVNDIETMLARMIGEDIQFRTIIDPEIGLVRADAGQLGQVLMNLAVNARDAMPQGGLLTIETRNVVLDDHYVNTHVEVNAGHYVLIMVSDTGVGMTPEVRARVFEPFFTTKSSGKGTGLGLSVVHGIVKQFNGKIGAYSEPYIGSVFKIYLPIVTNDLVPTAKAIRPIMRRRGTETILVVDDEAAVREISRLALANEGYHVILAKSGHQAIELAKSSPIPIDLLMTDVVMPGMNGRELAELMLQLFPSIRVLYSSGYTDDSVVRYGLLQAEVNFIHKPFTPRRLAQKVQEVFEG